jgi:integrase
LATKLPDSGLTLSAQAAFWIMLATACRVGELSKARWSEVNTDRQLWAIPEENSKNGRQHLIHLSTFAISQFEVLKGLWRSETWVFPDRFDKSHLSPKALQKQFHDRQRTMRLQGRSNKAGMLRLKSGEWRAHDLRRTSATLMGELGVRSDVIERVLNHIEVKKVTRIYQRQELLAERAQALRLLGEHIEALIRSATEQHESAANHRSSA